MEFNKSAIELIKERKSCRSFIEREVEPDKSGKLEAFISKINSGAGINARFLLIKREINENMKAEKLGTYGFISGAGSFIAGVISRDEKKVEIFGYYFEKIILYATGLGLGTCWLGGSFNRKDFNRKISLLESEFIPIVSPVGYARPKRRIIDNAVRALAGSGGRKPWNEIFFYTSPGKPLDQAAAGDYAIALEMLRMAPSASNKQPWRVIKDSQGYSFYLARTKNYRLPGFDIQRSDVGIAMCHFELSTKELKLDGAWQPGLAGKNYEGLEYIATWVPAGKN
jgi:nitroreductase